jgi:hypothetical protein
MRTFSGQKDRPPLDRARAWWCLLINALVCPGLGTLLARRRGAWPQLALAWGGAIWMVADMGRFFLAFVRLMQMPPDWSTYAQSGLGGLFLFVAGWIWAIISGLQILREAQPPPQPQAQPPPQPTYHWPEPGPPPQD